MPTRKPRRREEREGRREENHIQFLLREFFALFAPSRFLVSYDRYDKLFLNDANDSKAVARFAHARLGFAVAVGAGAIVGEAGPASAAGDVGAAFFGAGGIGGFLVFVAVDVVEIAAPFP